MGYLIIWVIYSAIAGVAVVASFWAFALMGGNIGLHSWKKEIFCVLLTGALNTLVVLFLGGIFMIVGLVVCVYFVYSAMHIGDWERIESSIVAGMYLIVLLVFEFGLRGLLMSQ